VTFADGVLKLVRAGARIELRDGAPRRAELPFRDEQLLRGEPWPGAQPDDFADDLAGAALLVAQEPQFAEPGLADLEAAVALVEAGVATRIVLAGFPSWPGLLWRAYQLADETGVVILPTVVRPGGLVDIVVARDPGADV
jgi:hypothetical protein